MQFEFVVVMQPFVVRVSNATVAAGSVITKDVPDDGLGVGRAKQNNKDNWAKKKD